MLIQLTDFKKYLIFIHHDEYNSFFPGATELPGKGRVSFKVHIYINHIYTRSKLSFLLSTSSLVTQLYVSRGAKDCIFIIFDILNQEEMAIFSPVLD